MNIFQVSAGDTGESGPCKSCPSSRTGIHAAIALR